MADSRRELIIREIKAAMDGYSFADLAGASVVRGQINFDANIESLPQVAILPQPEDATRDDYGHSVCIMPVDISCLIELGDNNASELGEAVLGELIQAVLSINSAYADDVVYVNGGVADYPNRLGQKVLAVGITVAVEYRFDIGNPYQQT